ncbi:hypothetical protein SAMN05421837_102581 [Amycolatopsis pretoriensis]|uniref:Uncharacterized protein n=1 Tax=Amycolatopsis pretoriensis TaxID=218821 RepID=A0A1H5QFH0_9PSEU|nr:hypothetical protein [Amycolatopsis pretoriensis]SEF24131.1 hypothetical protein SAMN05421837_102581 [Amycolatopsis pretoriensis]
MRRITATLGALALTTGVLLGATGPASAQAEPTPGVRCVGSSLAMWATNALCVVDRQYPLYIIPVS